MENNPDVDGNDIEDRGSSNPAHFTSESHAVEKVKSVFKKRLSRSSSRSYGSDKFSSFMQFFREATKMNWDFKVTLPSDKSWRMKNYFKLLYKQKEKKIVLHSMPSQESDVSSNWDPVFLAQPELKRAKFSGAWSVSSEGSLPTSYSLDISWNALDIAKAGMILESNSSGSVSFQDEEEMRRVFTLLYDVFRYKHILNEALLETRFFQKYPEHSKVTSLVWLLFYDLYKRRFLPREHAETILCGESFDQIGLTPIERDLWKAKVKLAASLARNRIKNNALRLNQLLPSHLRDERLVSPDDSPITGWINTFKMSKKEVCEKIEQFGLKLQSKHETVLTKSDFRFDHLCPKLLLCHPVQRPDLAQSTLVKDNTVVLQDRAFCIGPAIIAKILSEVPLRGTVAQSHVNSPRTTAYLANILADNDRLDKMIAFGAGDKLLEYQTYLHNLGVNNCEIYAQKFTEIHPDAAVLENLVAIFATPPNSCTGVTDPVDLICSRGGDMYMLKDLTRSDMTGSSCAFLEEQRETLEYSMSLPQVQIVLYETHSMAPEENIEMVNIMIEKMNEFAKEKHEEDRRILQEQEAAEEKMNKPIGIPGMMREKEKEPREPEPPPLEKELVVPPCDLFEIVPLPALCSHGSECLAEEGCYLARIQRKEIISLDAKYMIKIAEARGLFGDELGQKKSSTVRAQKKREDQTQRAGSGKTKARKVKIEIERITAPTQSSIYRTRRDDTSISGFIDCPRHHFHTLESANKVDLLSARSGSGSIRRKSRTKKCQDENMRRLSKPSRRWSTSPSEFLTEVRPSFWRYATAKSVEDLIRTLRKKKRSKRGFRLDTFLFHKQKVLQQHQNKKHLDNEEGIPGLQINYFGQKYLYPFRTPYICNKWTASTTPITISDDYFEEILFLFDEDESNQPLEVNRGGFMKQTETATPSVVTLIGEENSELFRQCLQNAEEIFKNIETVIEEEQGKIMKPFPEERRPLFLPKKINKVKKNMPQKDRMKLYKYLQGHQSRTDMRSEFYKITKEGPQNFISRFISKHHRHILFSFFIFVTDKEQITEMDEVNNIINPTKTQDKKDIVLHQKYLPGDKMTVEDKRFIKLLRSKLEKLQGEFPTAHWTKKREQESASRLSSNKKVVRD